MESGTGGSMLSSVFGAAEASKMSPRLQELRRIKQSRYLKLDLLQPSARAAGTVGKTAKASAAAYDRKHRQSLGNNLGGFGGLGQSTGDTSGRAQQVGKKLCYLEAVTHSSPTCQSSMKERELFPEALFRADVPFHSQVR